MEAIEEGREYIRRINKNIITHDSAAVSVIQKLIKEIEAYQELIEAAVNLYDNRLGWSDGRNPYAPPAFWDNLHNAINKLNNDN